jgi:hypothetical protein
MKTILNSTRRVYVALFVLAGMFAFAAQPVTAAEEAVVKGCWYEEGDPPACDICGWDCVWWQECCTINNE